MPLSGGRDTRASTQTFPFVVNTQSDYPFSKKTYLSIHSNETSKIPSNQIMCQTKNEIFPRKSKQKKRAEVNKRERRQSERVSPLGAPAVWCFTDSVGTTTDNLLSLSRVWHCLALEQPGMYTHTHIYVNIPDIKDIHVLINTGMRDVRTPMIQNVCFNCLARLPSPTFCIAIKI